MPAIGQRRHYQRDLQFHSDWLWRRFTDPLIGSFTVTFDEAVSGFDTTDGLSAVSLNRTIGSTIGYWYDSAGGEMIFGGLDAGAFAFQANTDDFLVSFINVTAANPGGTSGAVIQTRVSSINFSANSAGTGGFTPVPEPAGRALLGLAGLGLARRKRAA